LEIIQRAEEAEAKVAELLAEITQN